MKRGRKGWTVPYFYPAAFRRLCVETQRRFALSVRIQPAAFRRLCVETAQRRSCGTGGTQPPSGGCVLKHTNPIHLEQVEGPAAFRRLCVETSVEIHEASGKAPAAFRRLCVETGSDKSFCGTFGPAAFRRLCVETRTVDKGRQTYSQPPSGGCVLKPRGGQFLRGGQHPAAFRRLCVETADGWQGVYGARPAAFGRLCVETTWGFLCPVENNRVVYTTG